jgi:hypothetical protein
MPEKYSVMLYNHVCLTLSFMSTTCHRCSHTARYHPAIQMTICLLLPKGLELQFSKHHRAPLSMKSANPRFICSGPCACNNNVSQSIQVLGGTTTSEYMWAHHFSPKTWINIKVAASSLYNHVLNSSTHYKNGQHSTLTCHYCQCQWWFDSLRAVPGSKSPANQDSKTKIRGPEDQTHDSNMWYSMIMKCSKVRLSNLFSSFHDKVSTRIKRTLPCNNNL